MQTIVEIKFGSHLYGTSTPSSDLDIKGIYLPAKRNILLQSIEPVIIQKRLKKHGEKNNSEDIDYELYSPAKFLKLLAEGQTVALDMLFAPDEALLAKPHFKWQEIKEIAPKLFTKKAISFVRYCRQQANKYGIKGSRVAAARLALEALTKIEQTYGSSAKLGNAEKELRQLVQDNEFLKKGDFIDINGIYMEYLEICGKKALFNASIKSARQLAEKIFEEYGSRALAAETNEGVDWKALSHAVRVGNQAIEFLQFHHINFPRPEAKHLLAIKKGEVAFNQVAEEIEQLLVKVEEVAAKSTLPDDFNQNIIDDFLIELHLGQVLK